MTAYEKGNTTAGESLILLGTSASHDIGSLCEFDVMAFLRSDSKLPCVSELDVDIMTDTISPSDLPARSTDAVGNDQDKDEDEYSGAQVIDESEFNDAKEELESIVGLESSAVEGVVDTKEIVGNIEANFFSKSESAITDTDVPSSFCTVKLRIEYTPSKKDQQEKLFELLNQASKRKAQAIERLRRSAAAVSRGNSQSATSKEHDGEGAELTTSPSRAVEPGFLNKKKRPRSKIATSNFFVNWYNRILGPQSLFALVFPIAKNYCLFFGAVAFVHWKGDLLALPAPL